MRRIRVMLFVLSVSFFAAAARGQVATGTPPFGSFSGGPFDTINNGNLNVHFSIPVLNKAGRGLPFQYNVSYDNSVWYPVGSSGGQSWQPVYDWGWTGWTEAGTGYMSYNQTTSYCNFWNGHNYQQVPYEVVLSDFIYYDQWGVGHPFPGEDNIWSNPGGGCPSGTSSWDTAAIATDGSGYTWNGQTWTMTNAQGNTFHPPYEAPTGTGSISDANGNTISNTAGGVFTDTLGVTALTVSGNGTQSSPVTFQYTGAGGSATVTVQYASKTVRTNFGCSGISEFGPTAENLVTEIDMPDINTNPSDKYTFAYEATPNYSGDVTGRLASVTLPTGATISYNYENSGDTIPNDGVSCSDGSTTYLARTTPDSSTAWVYSRSNVSGAEWETQLTDPNSNVTTYYFEFVTPTGSTTAQTYETERDLPSTTDSETIYTCYNGASKPCDSTAISLPITERTVWTTLGSQTSEVDTSYDSYGYGLAWWVDEYDWGLTLVRRTGISHNFNTSCGVTNPTVIDRLCGVTVWDGSNHVATSISYTYDANGNLLKQTPSVGPQLQFSYNTNGTVATTNDGAGTTNYGYGSNSCNAFPDTVTPPISSLATTAVWNCNGALPTSITDPNSKTTNLTYDLMDRLTGKSYPDGGSVTVAYTPTQVQTTTKITSSVSRTDTANLDSQGRVSSKTVAGVTTSTTPDSLGRVSTVSVSGSGAQDTYQYDALGRTIKVTHADSTYVQTSYSNNCSTTADESSKVRQVCSDGLGRVNSVTEDPSGLNYQTTYGYDPLNDLTGVTQGSESRSFSYDGLARLTQTTTPESGTVYFTYDSDSTCGSSAGDLVKRVDARGTRTCYAYDTVHRLTSKSYSDGTATANFYYDQTSYNGLTIANGKGRRTGMSDGSGQTAWNYDAMGRALTEEKTISGITKKIADTFNYDGSLASLTYPSSRIITYGVDTLGRPLSAVDSANSVNYATSATYAAQGALASVLSGKTSSFGGITYSLGYNDRLLPSSISASSSNGTALSLSYSYFGNGSADVITNNRDNGRTVTYGYDSLNRWNSASSQATSGADCWGQSVPSTGYDRYGNLLTINVTKCSAPALSISVNGNNRITNSGFTYDASGDETADGLYSYAWDAEARMTSGAGVTYTYDGDGQRAKKSSGTLYWRGGSGSVVAETDTSGNTTNEYIFFGARIARRDSSGNVYYYFGNHLGSAAITNATGTPCYDADFYPIGGELAFTNTCSQSYKFAGMEQDSETGEYHTQYRQYASNLSRWLSPDPSGTAAVSLANPQTWNMYAYVTNNPTTLTDATGLDSSGWNPCDQYYCGPPPQYEASYDENYDPNSWMLPNPISCMAWEYGCAGSPSEINAGEQQYLIDNCIGCVWVHGTLYGHPISKIFSSFAAWANYATSQAALPQIVGYGLFSTYAATEGLDPNKTYTVYMYYQGLELNIQVDKTQVVAVPSDYVEDPFTFMHGGNGSYLDLWSLFDAGHYVLGPIGGYHEDVFGVLNPFHYADWLGGWITGRGPTMTFTCQVGVGCY